MYAKGGYGKSEKCWMEEGSETPKQKRQHLHSREWPQVWSWDQARRARVIVWEIIKWISKSKENIWHVWSGQKRNLVISSEYEVIDNIDSMSTLYFH